MYRAKDIMNSEIVAVDPDDTIELVIDLMQKRGISGLPVVDMSGQLVGIITEFDLMELYWDPTTAKNKVFHYMTREVRRVDEDDEVDAVAEMFRMLAIRRLMVMRDDQVVGIISRRDLLRHVQQLRRQGVPNELAASERNP